MRGQMPSRRRRPIQSSLSGSNLRSGGRSSSSFLLLPVRELLEVFSRTRRDVFNSTLSCLSVLTHEFFERLAATLSTHKPICFTTPLFFLLSPSLLLFSALAGLLEPPRGSRKSVS